MSLLTSFGELFFQHLSKQPPSPRESVPLILPSIEAVVLKALAKDPLQRFPSVQAFADALKQAHVQDMQVLSGGNEQQPGGKHKQVLTNSDLQTLIPNNEQALKGVPTQPKLTRRILLAAVAGGGGALVLAAGIAAYFPTFFGSHSHAATDIQPTPSVGGSSKHQSTPTSQSTPAPTPGTTITTYTGHSQDVKSVVWSPDGNHIASGSIDKTIHIWDASTGKRTLVYTAHTNQVKSVSWSSDGRYVASGDLGGIVHIWDPVAGKDVFASPYSFQPFEVRCVTWKPNTYVIASGGSDKTVQVWNAATGQRIQAYTGYFADLRSIAWFPDGTQIASGYADGTLHVWNATTGQLAFSLDTGQTHEVWNVAWSQDGKQIAAACQSGPAQVLVWDATTQHLVFFASVPAHIAESVAWSPNSTLLAAGSKDGTVQIWNMSTKQLVLTYHQQTREIWSVAWSPDGKRMVSGSADGTARVWWTVGITASRPPNDIHPT